MTAKPKSDLEIAQSAKIDHINNIA
ncbi:MAG TPA: hypothetical protein PLC65_14605, partial [Bacteroidia bacterium]|nr:hypothetical protein [Bacteroidia bacterium]